MYININRESLVITHKHYNARICSMLAQIECAHFRTLTTFCDELQGFGTLTDLELKLLIKNSNGPDVSHVWSRDSLCKILMGMCATLPLFEPVNGFELEHQLASIPPDDGSPYRYVPGGYAPEPAEGLEELALLYVAGSKPIVVPEFKPVAPAIEPVAPTPSTWAPKPPRAPATPDEFVSPKPGTSTFQIFDFCTQAWKAAEFKDDESIFKQIKKQAVDKLTAQGLNVSTVRVQSQRWYQNRRVACGLV